MPKWEYVSNLSVTTLICSGCEHLVPLTDKNDKKLATIPDLRTCPKCKSAMENPETAQALVDGLEEPEPVPVHTSGNSSIFEVTQQAGLRR